MVSNIFITKANKEKSLKKIKFNEALDKMPIKKRLFTSFMTILIISNLASILGLAFLQKTNSDYNNALINYGFAQGEIGKFGMEVENISAVVRDILTTEDLNEQVIAKKKLEKSFKVIDETLPLLESKSISKEEIENLNKIKDSVEKYKTVATEVTSSSTQGEKQDAINAMINPIDPSGICGIIKPIATPVTLGFTSKRVIKNASNISPTRNIITFSRTL